MPVVRTPSELELQWQRWGGYVWPLGALAGAYALFGWQGAAVVLAGLVLLVLYIVIVFSSAWGGR